MIRSELIQKIADENPHLTQRHVERIVNTVFEEIIEALYVVIGSNCADLARFQSSRVMRERDETRAQASRCKLKTRRFPSLRPASCCATD